MHKKFMMNKTGGANQNEFIKYEKLYQNSKNERDNQSGQCNCNIHDCIR